MNWWRVSLAVGGLWGAVTGLADVRIVAPTNGTIFPAYSTVTIEVEPEFKDGDNSVRYGVVGNEYFPENMIAVRDTPPYSLTVSNLPAGTHRYAAWTSDSSPRAFVDIVVTNPPVHTGPYSVVTLDIAPTGINNDGVVVGNSGDRAFTWHNGIIRWVPMPNSNRGWALAINNAGQITGALYISEGEKTVQRAFLCSGGVTRTIEIPGADSSLGLSISPGGDVLGVFLGEGGFSRGAFVYTAQGVLTTNSTLVRGEMNSWGIFAGTSEADRRAVMYGPALNQMLEQQLGPLLSPSGAEDINDAGQVAAWGRALRDNRHNHHDAFLYSNYKLIQLTSGFYHEAYARALNRWGQVVGDVTETLHGPGGDAGFTGYGEKRHYLWSEGGEADLSEAVKSQSIYVLDEVIDINDHGQIAGYSTGGTGLLLNPRPKVLETRVEDGELKMLVHERPGTTLKVASTIDFKQWTWVSTNSGGPAIRTVRASIADGGDFKFYQVINDTVYGNQVVGN